MGSTAEAREVIKPFDVADTVYLKGVTVEQAREAMALCASGSGKVPPDAAAAMVDRLLDFYGHQSFRSPSAAAAFSAALVTLVTEVSYNAARRAFHPATGLPRKEEFLSVAKVAKALQEEEARFFRIAAHARWVIDQKELADRRAAEDAAIEEGKGSAEQRAARVAELMASLKTKTSELTGKGGNAA